MLTEVSNFIDQANAADRPLLFESFTAFIKTHEELYEAALTLSEQSGFYDLGLSDTGLLHASSRATVLTLDGALYSRILNLERNAVYFPI